MGDLLKVWLASVIIRKVLPWLAVIVLAIVVLIWWAA